MIRSLLKKLWRIITHVQVLAVFFAFAFMVILSYRFMSDNIRKNLLNDVENVFINTQAKIDAQLSEPTTALGVVSMSVQHMLDSGYGFSKIKKYFEDSITFFSSEETLDGLICIYGFFNGHLVTCDEITPLSEDELKEKPWYISATEAGVKTGITNPVFDAEFNGVITFSKTVYDALGNSVGFVCIDMKFDKIFEYAVKSSVKEGTLSYGILFDKNFDVLAHPVPENFIGRNIVLMNDGVAIKEILVTGASISERIAHDFANRETVLFFRPLNNGWYLAILAYAKDYYQTVYNMAYLLVFSGTVLAVCLSAILLSLVFAKKRAEERTHLMLNALPLCADIWDNKYNIIDCNNESLKLFGAADKKDYIERFFDFSPEYQPDGRLSVDKSNEAIKKAFDEGYNRFEWLHRSSKGELIPCEVTLVRVKHRERYIVCGYTRDLRDLKMMMTKMREADECTQILFDATPLGCIMIDNSFNVLECNQDVLRLLNIPSKQIYIDRVYDFWPEYQPSGEVSKEKMTKYINEAFEEGYCRFEWIHQTLDGEQIPTEVVNVRVKFKGVYAVACYIRDLREIKAMIAEMRRAEIAEESSKAKSDFLAKMSHEIRTPMNAILGITEIQLQDNTLPLVTKEALERIYNSGDLLLGIINDILDLSKIEAGKLELNYAQYDIASLIHDVAKLNIIRYESKPIDFKVTVNENTPKTLVGDEIRIKQILNNLLSNAFKYTQEGKIELSLSTQSAGDESKITVVFQVKDTGQGMTADQVKRLGDKFARFNMEANRTTEGTGLGMNITRNLIQLMNGVIHIESTVGEGSKFTVQLPQCIADNTPVGKEISQNLMKLNLKTPAKMRNMQISQEFMPYGRVLIVDDVETNLYVARGLLAPYGLSIDTAFNGFETLEKIKNGAKYDVIFMDHMMPRMDGVETVKLIREMGYSEPVVALTANALAGQAEMFFKNGFDDFVSKPIDIRQLNNILNRLIRDKQPANVLQEAKRQKNNLYASGEAHGIAVDPQLAEFFVRDAKKAASLLETICENNCRRADDMPVFIINIHAMKSALANVGERELSADAAQLEQAGREQNIKLIGSRLPDFLKELRKVIDKLKPSQDDLSPNAPEVQDVDRAFLQEQLLVIQAACASLDKKTAKEAVMNLKQKTWPRDIRDLLSAISEHLLHSEFEEAAAITRNVFFTK